MLVSCEGDCIRSGEEVGGDLSTPLISRPRESKVSFTTCVQYRTCALCQCCNCIPRRLQKGSKCSVRVGQGASSDMIWVNWELLEVEGFRKLAANSLQVFHSNFVCVM